MMVDNATWNERIEFCVARLDCTRVSIVVMRRASMLPSDGEVSPASSWTRLGGVADFGTPSQ